MAFLEGFRGPNTHLGRLQIDDVNHLMDDSAIKGTEIGKILDLHSYDLEYQCPSSPVIRVEKEFDTVIRHESCPWLHRQLEDYSYVDEG